MSDSEDMTGDCGLCGVEPAVRRVAIGLTEALMCGECFEEFEWRSASPEERARIVLRDTEARWLAERGKAAR